MLLFENLIESTVYRVTKVILNKKYGKNIDSEIIEEISKIVTEDIKFIIELRDKNIIKSEE